MQSILIMLHVLAAVVIIVLILLQQGKGADIGAAFGSGAANSVFGSSGPSSFLFKLTGTIAAIFFATSLAMGYLSSKQVKQTKGPSIERQIPIAPTSKQSSSKTKTDNNLPNVPLQ